MSEKRHRKNSTPQARLEMEGMPIPQEGITAIEVSAQQTEEIASVATQLPPIEPTETALEPPEVEMT